MKPGAERENNLGGTAVGATPVADGVCFRVWAPAAGSVEVQLLDGDRPKLPLEREGEYFQGVVQAAAGDRYWYWLDKTLRRPDPASASQPDGVHGPSQVLDPAFPWRDDNWQGLALDKAIFYELHVGTFTPEGTFEAAITRLDYLLELGITAIELMPVAQFPGERNWGYDGTFPFAPQNSYGGAAGLKKLVDACHCKGLAVFLDVVYNHLGPEGNYLHAFGPYFTDRYRTPWGDAVNFDGPGSDEVRRYFIANALYWLTEYHIDGLRLDAVHGIFDFSARHILEEMAAAVHRKGVELGRQVHLIAESDLNDVRLIKPVESGGYGLDAQWNDDFHHALHSLLTGEKSGYYADFGEFADLIKSFSDGFVISGEYSTYRMRCHGSSSRDCPPGRLVVFSQNHDQVGNRLQGERLSEHLSGKQLMLAAAAVLLSPYLPLLFMGEDYGERAPFPYFVSHSDAELVSAVRLGRVKECAAFSELGSPPDPQAEQTFFSARIDPEQRHSGEQAAIFNFYRELIRLRKESPPLASLSRDGMEISADGESRLLAIIRSLADEQVVCLFNFSGQYRLLQLPVLNGTYRLLLASPGDPAPAVGPSGDNLNRTAQFALSPFSVAVYRRD